MQIHPFALSNRSIVICGLLALLSVFIVEHFSSFSIINSKTVLVEQITPFGTKIITDTGTVPCVFTKVELKNYADKVPFYLSSVFKDFKYLVLIWVLYIILYFIIIFKIRMN